MIYIGDKKVTRCYLGDQRIGKVYRGDELLLASRRELVYHGTIKLSTARAYCAAATIGNYALFGGGQKNTASTAAAMYSSVVDGFDSALTAVSVVSLSATCHSPAATTIGNYALFAGGMYKSSLATVSSIYFRSNATAYDKNLSKTTATSLSAARGELAATTVGDYALFAGGSSGSSTNGSVNAWSSVVNAYDTALVRTIQEPLTTARSKLAAVTVGNYALFGGGYSNNSAVAVVDAYDAALTRTTPTQLSKGRYNIGAARVGNYTLFAGGFASDIVDAYDSTLTRIVPESLSAKFSWAAGTSINGFAAFCGNTSSRLVNAYDPTLTRTIPELMSTYSTAPTATSVGDYALFGANIGSGVIDVYKVQ